MSKVAAPERRGQPRSLLSMLALATSACGAACALPIAWNIHAPVPGDLISVSAVGWLALSAAGICLGIVQRIRARERRWQPALAVALPPLSLLVVVLAALVALGSMGHAPESMPSDDDMLASFDAHRHELSTLRRMLEKDRKLRALSFDSTDPDGPGSSVTKARVARYRDLMREAGIGVDIGRGLDGRDGIWLRVAYTGNVLTSDERGYLYSKTLPRPLLASLDGPDATARYVFRHISGHWYLYRWMDP